MTAASSSKTTVSWARYLTLCVCLVICAVAEWRIYYRYQWMVPNIALVAGAIAAAILLGRPRPLTPLPSYGDEVEPRWRFRLGVVAALTGVVLLTFSVHLLGTQWEESFGRGWLGVVAGVAIGSVGLSLLDRRLRKTNEPVRWQRWEVIAFLLILGLGLFLRFYRYDEFPPPDGVCAVEEPQEGQGAFLTMEEGLRWWEFMLDRWLPVPFWMLFGRSLTTLRIPFTIVSWLTIIPLYLLLRQLVSRPSALFATGLFAICRWHLVYARLAHAIFGPTLPLILTAVYLCVRVHRRGGLAAYPWIGLLCGATLFAYAGYRGTTLFIGLFFVISLLWHLRAWRRAGAESRPAVGFALRTQVAGILLFAVGLSSVALPLYGRLVYNPTFFVEAAVRATDDTLYYSEDENIAWLMRQRRLRQIAMMFLHSGDNSGTFNLPGSPQLDPVSGALFVVGLIYCVIYAAYRFQGFFAVYFLVLLFMGTFFVHNFDIRRLQGLIPLIFVLIAFAIDRFGHLTLARFGSRGRVVLATLAVILGGLAFADNYDVYFRRMMHDRGVRTVFHNRYTIGYRYLLSLPQNAYLIAVTDMVNFFAPSDYEWLWRSGPPGHSTSDLTPLFRGEAGPWTGRELHLLIQQPQIEAPQLATLLAQRFPGAACAPFFHPDRSYPEFWTCDVPAAIEPRPWTGNVTARYYRGDAAEPLLVRQQPVISYAFFPEECMVYKGLHQPPCRAEYDATWHIDETDNYQLMVQAWQGELTVMLDGKVLHRGSSQKRNFVIDDMMQRGVRLQAGDHTLHIEAKLASLERSGVRVHVRREAAQQWELLWFGD
jgi:hypothetical protein